MAETTALTIAGPDGKDEVELPTQLLEMLAEDGQSGAEVVGDLAVMSCAQRVHATVHHAEGEADDMLLDVEETLEPLFEERFGGGFAEVTGHQH